MLHVLADLVLLGAGTAIGAILSKVLEWSRIEHAPRVQEDEELDAEWPRVVCQVDLIPEAPSVRVVELETGRVHVCAWHRQRLEVEDWPEHVHPEIREDIERELAEWTMNQEGAASA